MKRVIALLFIFLPFILSAQKVILKLRCDGYYYVDQPPIVYVNFTKIPYQLLEKIKPTDIESVNVVKTEETKTEINNGTVYITLKKGAKFVFYDFANFKKKFIQPSNKPTLLLLNGNIITDYSDFAIAEKTIRKVEINDGADIAAIKNIYSKFNIINILTNDVFNGYSISNIMLQGLPLDAEPK